MTHRHAIIFTGGDAPHERALHTVSATTATSSDTIIIAADSGWEHAVAARRTPDILVGDMDSKIYYKNLGKYESKIPENKRVYFKTMDQAMEAGYHSSNEGGSDATPAQGKSSEDQ